VQLVKLITVKTSTTSVATGRRRDGDVDGTRESHVLRQPAPTWQFVTER